MHKRIIITGAPGTGKTSLINTLRQEGYSCFPEISRQIIMQQQLQKSDKTPWGDLLGFIDLVYQQTIKELKTPIKKYTFVDRGLPDTIAYLKASSYPVPQHLLHFPFKNYYNTTVFFAPFWEDIYVPDPQRQQSNNEAKQIHNTLLNIYEELNFKIEILPKTTLTKRVDFISSII